MSIRARSRAFAFRFRSLNSMTPHANDTSTEPLLMSDTTEIMESGWLRAGKYAKSAEEMNIDMSGIAQLQWNLVVFFLFGYHIMAQTAAMMNIW